MNLPQFAGRKTKKATLAFLCHDLSIRAG
jgi:hypothetical protein